jgi:SAM-dependent methyltransferase
MERVDDVRSAVREHYAQIATSFDLPAASSDCCGGADCCGNELYDADISAVPLDVQTQSLGCGDPITLASLRPGQTVLDLGSGAGLDAFLAAERVGPTGQVIGVDMTPAMLARANANRDRLGRANVSFRHGHIEELPVESESIDVIISNCVINLSPDKPAVFREAFRVLKPGGRLAVSDVLTQGYFSAEQRADMDAWAACISGAEDVADYVAAMRAAGFTDISVRDKAAPQIELSGLLSLPTAPRLFSGVISAVKPG